MPSVFGMRDKDCIVVNGVQIRVRLRRGRGRRVTLIIDGERRPLLQRHRKSAGARLDKSQSDA